MTQPVEQTAPETESQTAVVNEVSTPDNSATPSFEADEVETPKDDDKSVRADLLRAVKEENDKAERARNEKGQFAKEPKVKPTEAAPEKAAPVDTKSSTQTEDKPAEQPSTAIREAPKSWGKEHSELWKTLPQAAQDFLSTREEQISKGFEQYGPVKQIFDRYQPVFQSLGVAPTQFFDNAVSWHQALSHPQTKEAAAREFLATYGINPSTVPQSSEQQQQPFDVNSLQPVIQHQVNQALTPMQQQIAAWQNERTQSEIGAWSKDKPHFEKVRIAMGKLLGSGTAGNLDEAYQAAIWADPTIRDELTKTEMDKRLKAEQERSQKAKSATVSNPSRAPSAPVGTQTNGKDESVRDSIMRAIAEVSENQRA